MKKSLLALAVLGGFASVASAQSSVTIWGVVDLSANYVKNGDTKTKTLQSNQLNSNRLGFRGVEDLGGGMKAGFWLEAGMNNENGGVGGGVGNVNGASTTTMFNRRSTVSLMGNWGEVRLGRDYDPSFWNTVYFDVDGANGLGQGLNLISSLGSGANTVARANNTIGYFLPSNLGGIYGQAMVASSNGANNGQKYYGGRLGYAAGPFDVAAAYGDTKIFGASDFKMMNVGGSWDFGVAKLYAYWNRNTWGDAKQNVYDVSVGVPAGPGEIRGVVGYAKGSGTSPASVDWSTSKAKLYSLEYVYNMSKRTALYATVARISNSGTAAFSVLPGTASDASLKGGNSTGGNIGIRHSF